ncbi:DUF4956 domain-containing protein [Alkalibaculum sp. M08DMB]|uniref:DUF4956 domain-containing protein n=1 Tax=Alkalibaculum sporogenes TaxID=2655001 RepID=A0A6A7K8V3_9FIRM|nr:DUF4956 domain-containing protein [Alkalibaculum sporogenes]MPW25617.1 DUF4956 domain-containing protein [Alkalibaculum sporogenes]
MTFDEILKTGFLEKITEFSIIDATIALLCSFIIGLFIYFIYRKTFSGVMYSEPFNTSLVLLSMLTTLIILAVTTNVVLSLGMVGALSIVRFRTAIKDPLDLVFLFWSIGAGIILGAGLLPLAILGSVLIGTVLLGFQSKNPQESSYILMLNLENEIAEVTSSQLVKAKCKKLKIKSKSITKGCIELIYEVRVKNNDTIFMNELSSLEGVSNATLVSYNGEYAA